MIELTAPSKNSITVESPVLFAAGAVGYDGHPYRRMLALDKFGAMVTTPLSYKSRYPAAGTRVIDLPSGFLLHTGLPNPGSRRTIKDYERNWERSILPVIVHLIGTDVEDIESAVRLLDLCDSVSGIELGLHEQISMRELRNFIQAVTYNCDIPLLVRLPMYSALTLSEVAQHSGADAIVVAAPPRGTQRTHDAGRLVGGRVYGSWQKAQALHLVGRLAQYVEIPIIGLGGIETPDDARDFMIAGATAVQLDGIVWKNPKMAETIARNLGGGELTRTSGSLADEWQQGNTQAPPPAPPKHLPESPSDDATQDYYDPPFDSQLLD